MEMQKNKKTEKNAGRAFGGTDGETVQKVRRGGGGTGRGLPRQADSGELGLDFPVGGGRIIGAHHPAVQAETKESL